MALAENDDMIQALAPDRIDQALGERILPGAVRRREDFLDPHALHPVPEVLAVDPVTVAQEIGGRGVIRERLHDLLGGPVGGGVLGHVEVDDASAMVREHDENEENALPHGGDRGAHDDYQWPREALSTERVRRSRSEGRSRQDHGHGTGNMGRGMDDGSAPRGERGSCSTRSVPERSYAPRDSLRRVPECSCTRVTGRRACSPRQRNTERTRCCRCFADVASGATTIAHSSPGTGTSIGWPNAIRRFWIGSAGSSARPRGCLPTTRFSCASRWSSSISRPLGRTPIYRRPSFHPAGLASVLGSWQEGCTRPSCHAPSSLEIVSRTPTWLAVGAVRRTRARRVSALRQSASAPIRRAASRRSSALEVPPRAPRGRRHPCTN